MKLKDVNPKPDSCWAVICECRFTVIQCCISGKGFYLPGQEPCWGFDHVQDWLYEVENPYKGLTTYPDEVYCPKSKAKDEFYNR